MPSVTNRVGRYEEFDQLNGPYLDWQVDQFRDIIGQRVLEMGCGIGGILERLPECETVVALDVEADVLSAVADRFTDRPHFNFDLLDISTCDEDRLERLASNQFDTVVCTNVLEHISDDVTTLKRLERLVVPGGRIVLLVPAHLCLFGKYDLIDGHFRRYSKRYLSTILKQTSLTTSRMHYFNLLGAVGWWVQYKLLRRSIHGGSQFRIMNSLIPLMRPLEKMLPVPFGLSLIAILTRPVSEP